MNDVYDPFAWLLWMGVAGYWLMLGAVVLGGAAVSVWAARRKRWLLLAIGMAIVLTPALLFHFRATNADEEFAQRRADVLAMRRMALPPDYPRLLLVDGRIAPATASALMVAGHFDRAAGRELGFIDMFVNPVRDARCLTAARQWLTPTDEMSDKRRALPGILETCVTKTETNGAVSFLTSDAVIMRLDTRATLRSPGRDAEWSQGIVEIQLKREGREQLVDYRERPHVERPASMWSPLAATIDAGPPLNAQSILLEALAKAGPS